MAKQGQGGLEEITGAPAPEPAPLRAADHGDDHAGDHADGGHRAGSPRHPDRSCQPALAAPSISLIIDASAQQLVV
jgi:hypothetical protein